jgi:hypothetical protein
MKSCVTRCSHPFVHPVLHALTPLALFLKVYSLILRIFVHPQFKHKVYEA